MTVCCKLVHVASSLMIDRRGHRKLRLTSRKHFKPKPKRNCNKPQELDLGISLPLSAYIDGSVKTVENLQIRLQNYEAVPSGIYLDNIMYAVAWWLYICIGWNSELNNGFLSIYRLEFHAQSGPEVLLSLTIQENFSWVLSYRKLHVNQALCSILKNMPSQINTGMLFNGLYLYIHMYNVS